MSVRPGPAELDEGGQPAHRRDYRAILIRRCWWLTVPWLLLGMAGAAVAQLWPPKYRSQATVLVEQQKVPEQYVTPNVMADLQYRLDSMTQQILSRTRLQRLIEDFGLYSRDRARLPLDEVIDQMRKDVQVELVQTSGRQNELTAFRIYFLADTPPVAQRVANEVTSLFIEENLRARTQQSVNTTNFLETQLEQAHKDLLAQEKRLREYKLRYLGELPEQEQGNLQILSSLESQLQIGAAALDRAEQQKIYLESLRGEYHSMADNLAMGRVPGVNPDPAVAAVQSRLRTLQAMLAEFKIRYTRSHPDLAAVQQQIADGEAYLRQLEAAARKKTADADGPVASATAAEVPDRGLADIESRLKALNVEIAKGKADAERLRARIQEVQKRIGSTPVREQELTEVRRNYENSRTYYQSLLQKKLSSELATNLEKRQQGEQFRVLDPASLPEKPCSPNRLQIVAMGWLLGLCAGVGLGVVRELAETVVRHEDDLETERAIPVLVRIPILRSPREQARLIWRRRLEASWATLIFLLALGTTAHSYLAH